jgi:hypothetical protein
MMSNSLPDDVVDSIRAAVFAGQKIQAIKLHREATGMGLKESKDFIETLEAELRSREPEKFTAPPGGKGCAGVVLLLIVVVAAASAAASSCVAQADVGSVDQSQRVGIADELTPRDVDQPLAIDSNLRE